MHLNLTALPAGESPPPLASVPLLAEIRERVRQGQIGDASLFALFATIAHEA